MRAPLCSARVGGGGAGGGTLARAFVCLYMCLRVEGRRSINIHLHYISWTSVRAEKRLKR